MFRPGIALIERTRQPMEERLGERRLKSHDAPLTLPERNSSHPPSLPRASRSSWAIRLFYDPSPAIELEFRAGKTFVGGEIRDVAGDCDRSHRFVGLADRHAIGVAFALLRSLPNFGLEDDLRADGLHSRDCRGVAGREAEEIGGTVLIDVDERHARGRDVNFRQIQR